MSSAQSPVELAGRPVTVMGLGLFGGGAAVARWLCARGARVTVTDLRAAGVLAPTLRELEGLSIELVLGEHRESDFTRAELVVANPAVPPASPYLRAAQEAGVPITSEMALFLERAPARLVAITGTQGKSSTASFTAQLLGSAGFRVHLGGNIGRSLLEDLESMQPSDIAVLELSSYQLEALPDPPFADPASSPVEAAAIVNVLADHLERHGTREAYVRAKLRILEIVQPEGLVMLPSEHLAAVRGRRLRALPIDAGSGSQGLAHVDGRFLLDGEELGRRADLVLPGEFQAHNVMAALALARTMGADPPRLASALGSLQGLPHRLESLGWRAGRHVIDNGVSTTPDSTRSALREIEGACTLLLGGKEKLGLPFDELAGEIARRSGCVGRFRSGRPLDRTRHGTCRCVHGASERPLPRGGACVRADQRGGRHPVLSRGGELRRLHELSSAGRALPRAAPAAGSGLVAGSQRCRRDLVSVLANDARLEAERRRLSPYLSRVLERAAQLALEVHADFLSVEHVIGAVLRDEDSAANQTIVFAFADPETLGLELLALSPGIMVVGSAATRPFSPRAVEALERARRWAAASGSERVEIESLGAAAASVLPVELLAALRDAGYHDVVPPEPSASDPSRPAPSLRLAEAAKLALSRATKATARANEPAIGPARIFHACLQAGPELEARIGLTAARARLVLEGAFIDRSPLPSRELGADETLLAFLSRLPAHAGSLELLAACHHASTPELSELLLRHKIAPELLQRAAAELTDPE